VVKVAAETSTFSESWYRIAGHRVALRPHVVVRRQYFRGERYYVLHDPFNNQFFRLRPAAYEFVARLRFERTVEEVWHECVETDPDEAPGQDQVLRLLSQLHASNLLHSDLPPDTAKVFDRYEKKRGRELRGKWLNLLYARFPLWDPDRLLKRMLPLLRILFSPVGAMVWVIVVAIGIKMVVDHADEFMLGSGSVLAPSNLLLLYAATVVAKVVHEFGHACACRRLGGEVHVMGIMLMIFTPLPYVDTTSSWAFRSRWARALVGAGGMIAELFLAAIAAVVWANTGDGLVRTLAFNIIFVASISTLLFNLNPLLRFDGYYILSDLLEIPNLQTRSNKQVAHWVDRYGFGLKKSTGAADSRREAFWLGFYGIASKVYRLFVTVAILVFIAGEFMVLGLVLAILGLFGWFILPIGRFLRKIAFGPHLARNRKRAVLVTATAVLLIVGGLFLVPAPNDFRAPGVLESEERSDIVTATNGRLVELLAPVGSDVVAGQPLVRMENPELMLELMAGRAQLAEAKAMRERAMEEAVADLSPLDSRIEAVEGHLRELEKQKQNLEVRAPHAGKWLAPELAFSLNAWMPRGAELGVLVNPRSYRFSAVVSQEEASRLFGSEIRGAQVKLHGQASNALAVAGQQIIPAEQHRLPSAALGWSGGGEVAVAHDESGVKAKESFFEVRATVEPGDQAVLIHGLSGAVRFDLPPEPLGSQWVRKVRQLLQKRFGV
jgi:putative peptide zinc metalloprotease protein